MPDFEMEALRKSVSSGIADALAAGGHEEETSVFRAKGVDADEFNLAKRGDYVIGEEERNLPGFEALVLCKSSKDADAPAYLRELAEFNDEAYIYDRLIKTAYLAPATFNFGGVTSVRQTKWWKDRMRKSSLLKSAMDTAETSAGAEWVPTAYSADWWRLVYTKALVYGLFRELPMPAGIFKPPYQSTRITTYKVAEETAFATNAITQDAIGTGNFTLTAVKHGAQIPFSDELDQDSIVPMLPAIREDFAKAVGLGRDDAVQNGDTAATHQDNDVTTATNRKKLWNGLRKHALALTTTSLSTFNITQLRALRALMGEYGAEPDDLAFICGPKTYVSGFMGLSGVQANTQFGSQALFQNGRLMNVDGIQVVVSSTAREDLNASGVRDSTTQTKSTVILVNKTAWAAGNRKGFDIEVWRDIRYAQVYAVGTERKAFATPWTGTGQTAYHTVIGINHAA